MQALVLAAASALWLGILTSISPCPLATNVAAMTYISKRVGSARYVFASGLLYTLGRTLTYLLLAVAIAFSSLSVPELSFFLQRNMNKALGPILVIAGLLLLGVIPIGSVGPSISQRVQTRLADAGLWGAGLLGILFALSFCPTSAALFFGSLIPLALASRSSLLLPGLYGVGTAVPVFVFAVAIATGFKSVGKLFAQLSAVEKWARYATAAAFIGIGIYYSATYILEWGV